uniref:Vacuolar membrane protein n=1 Tax=Heterorhabditis bacteriophora TaxID=37862 RepID=A0A1I7X1W7_HETBA
MSSFYSGRQALLLAVAFSFLDVAVNMFGLAWNGKEFTIDNLRTWFDLSHYSFLVYPVDFLGVLVIWTNIFSKVNEQASDSDGHAIFGDQDYEERAREVNE